MTSFNLLEMGAMLNPIPKVGRMPYSTTVQKVNVSFKGLEMYL
jgi:hypothetical protein